MTPKASTGIEGRKNPPPPGTLPIPALALSISCVPLNAKSWMGTAFPIGKGRSVLPAATGGWISGDGRILRWWTSFRKVR